LLADLAHGDAKRRIAASGFDIHAIIAQLQGILERHEFRDATIKLNTMFNDIFYMVDHEKDRLLSKEECDQMISRIEYDRQALSNNDLKIKRKLRAWLCQIEDVSLSRAW
jgi:hypothetical protein